MRAAPSFPPCFSFARCRPDRRGTFRKFKRALGRGPEAGRGQGGIAARRHAHSLATAAAIATLDEAQPHRASLAFVAGALCGAVFVLTELLTDGALTRAAMNTITAFRPDRAKHVAIYGGRITKINLSEFNRNVAMLALALWSGLLALRALDVPRRVWLGNGS